MTNRLLPLVLLGVWIMPAARVHGGQEPEGQKPEGAKPPPAAAPAQPEKCADFRDLTICTRNVFLREEQSATTLSNRTLRDVEAGPEKLFSFDLEWKEQKFTCTEMTLKPRVSEQEVTCCKVEPVKTTDPVTGKTCTVYQQVPDVQKVTVTTYEFEPVEKEYIVRVPCLKKVETDAVIKMLAVDCTTVPAIEKRLHATIVPCEVHVKVPACPSPCVPQPPPEGGTKPGN
jgi:hypothetical protein